MSTTYPQSIDSFYRPVNGQDYVKAEHIYNLQDAVSAIEITLIGSGLDVNFDTDFVIPSNSSFKHAIEIIDQQLQSMDASATEHRTLSMLTDPPQHHANVIEISSGTLPVLGDIQPARVQTALEVIRNEILKIVKGDPKDTDPTTGNCIFGMHLDDNYVRRTGAAEVDGSLEVTLDTVLSSNVSLGSSISHIVNIAGSCFISGNLSVTGTSEFMDHIEIASNKSLGLANNLTNSFISFSDSATTIASLKDIIIRIDSDGNVGINDAAKLSLIHNLNDEIMSIDESGDMSLIGSLTVPSGVFTSDILIGSTLKSLLKFDRNEIGNSSYTIILNTEQSSAEESFVVNKFGYTGQDIGDTNMLLKANIEDGKRKLYSGTTILLPGVTEVGNFGFKAFSRNAGGEFYGQWVPFRQVKSVAPSSITLKTSTASDPCLDVKININSIHIGEITQYGFYIEADSIEVGMMQLLGTYEA